ncbi:MAG: hypothetical protein ACJ757_13940 [Gaiellaceae bacterium]
MTDARAARSKQKRYWNPSPDDPTGQRIIGAALKLIEEGTPFHELRLADAVERAAEDNPEQPLSRGAAYPRFPGGQPQFRLAVLTELLRREHARHRLEGATSAFEQVAAAMELQDHVSVEALRDFIESRGRDQLRGVADDALFPLRLYAYGLVGLDPTFPGRAAVIAMLQKRERQSDAEWSKLLDALAREFKLVPRDEFEPDDFEVLLSALVTGLAVRRLYANDHERQRLDDLYGRFVAAAALTGYFAVASDESTSLWEVVAERLERGGAPVRASPRAK